MNRSDQFKFSHPAFNFFLRRSSYIHVVLVLVMLVSGKVAFNFQQAERDKNLQLIQASVRVDMVAMPTHTINELKNLSSGVEEAQKEEKTEVVKEEPKEEVKEEPKEINKAAEKAAANELAFEEAQAKKRKEFLSKLKTIGNKKVESEGKQKADKGLYGEKDNALKDLVLSGNKVQKGSQMYGDGNYTQLTEYQAYVTRLPDIVRTNWSLPSYLADKKLKCRIKVALNSSGQLTRVSVHQSSGENEFDQRAIEAVKASAPFPTFNEGLVKNTQNIEVILGFPL